MIRPPLFKGVQTALMGQVPNGMLVYGSYEIYKRDLHDRFPAMNPDQVCVCVCPRTERKREVAPPFTYAERKKERDREREGQRECVRLPHPLITRPA